MSEKPSRPKRNRPEPGSKEARLSDALRANLQRRKAAARRDKNSEKSGSDPK